MLARHRWPVSNRTAAWTVALAVVPDVPHLLPIAGWWLFGSGTWATVKGFAIAVPGQQPAVPQWLLSLSEHPHCIPHSAIIAAVVSLLLCRWRRSLWQPLLGWWSHIVIDVFTHSTDYFAVPVLYPFTVRGFDGLAWNTPWFMVLNYMALTSTWMWLWRSGALRRHGG
jgi:hypothetical protein